jgi:hypothetical protein
MNSQMEIVGTREGGTPPPRPLSSWPQAIVSKGFVLVSEVMERAFVAQVYDKL